MKLLIWSSISGSSSGYVTLSSDKSMTVNELLDQFCEFKGIEMLHLYLVYLLSLWYLTILALYLNKYFVRDPYL